MFDTKMIDDQLPSWEKVKERFKKGNAILIGNGASQAIWAKFGYKSLYDRAKSGVDHPLSTEDTDVFKSLQTKNFEFVLGALSTAIKITKILHKDETFLQERYLHIQNALVEAVHSVHVECKEVPEKTLLQIRSAILEFEFVFSTNYDLLLYWAIMLENATGVKDYFWGDSLEFDRMNTETPPTATKVLYLHGGLHLYRLSSGTTRKRKAAPDANLLDLLRNAFGEGATPLFITEGTWQEKLASIGRSDYLSFAYSRFSQNQCPLVVFGHSLSDTDSHLVHAMKEWRSAVVAISMRQDDSRKIIERKAKLEDSLPKAELFFFDAATHPLGKRELLVPETPDDGDDHPASIR